MIRFETKDIVYDGVRMRLVRDRRTDAVSAEWPRSGARSAVLVADRTAYAYTHGGPKYRLACDAARALGMLQQKGQRT